MDLHNISEQPVFGSALSLICYSLALYLYRRWQWLHPLFVCSGLIIVFLISTDIPYEAYRKGGDALILLLGPATVVLGIPFNGFNRQYVWSGTFEVMRRT